ncbi:tetratricopeptide (TPR) repeat protein [Modestobacter versicolor]|uniref:Tetratricopeptide (TPR) repeat protein n=1 Tax=Modestobacter versicolor TaxID=429133 RepID=A0A839Y8X9_9ACTN|nr:tetratricopeptide (TPR) repeat protein [Modestobacter versicolor]
MPAPRDDDDLDVDALIDRGCELADLGEHEQAVVLFRRAAVGGDPVALFDLGNSLSALGRWAEAVEVHREAADAGEDDAWLNLAHDLRRLGRWAEAEHAARQAVDCGDPNGWAVLADTLRVQRGAAEAERQLRGAAGRGNASAALELAYDLRESGRQLEAWHWVQVAADAGDDVAAATLACWRWDETRDPSLEPLLRAGVAVYEHARTSLSHLLRGTDRVEEARALLEEGALHGEVASWLPLGNLYRDELDDDIAAEAAYRAGIEGGDLHSHHNLGVLLLDAGDVDGAIEHFSIAAAGGDDLAARVLREVLAEED